MWHNDRLNQKQNWDPVCFHARHERDLQKSKTMPLLTIWGKNIIVLNKILFLLKCSGCVIVIFKWINKYFKLSILIFNMA